MKITLEQIKTILSKAKFYPSPDNCQPWAFELSEETLSIFHLASRSKHPLNPANLASIISLGCLIEAIDLAASELDLKTQPEFQPFASDERALWAVLRFGPRETGADPLAKILSERTTDRRLYHGGRDRLESLDLSNESSSAKAHRLLNIPRELTDYIVETESFLADHPTALQAIVQWVRFSMGSARITGDGLSWRNMLVRFWEVPGMLLVRKFSSTARLLAPAVRHTHRLRTRAQLASSAAVICFSIRWTDEATNMKELVDVGRLVLRTWLQLNAAGFGVQPLSLSSLPLLYRRNGSSDEFFESRSDLLTNGELLLRKLFSISKDRQPIWMIRTGLSTPLPLIMRTFRKPALDVTSIR